MKQVATSLLEFSREKTNLLQMHVLTTTEHWDILGRPVLISIKVAHNLKYYLLKNQLVKLKLIM